MSPTHDAPSVTRASPTCPRVDVKSATTCKVAIPGVVTVSPPEWVFQTHDAAQQQQMETIAPLIGHETRVSMVTAGATLLRCVIRVRRVLDASCVASTWVVFVTLSRENLLSVTLSTSKLSRLEVLLN